VVGPSAGGIAMDLSPSRGLPLLLSGAALLMLAGLGISACHGRKSSRGR
jgi:hypothetical protein